MEELNNLLSGFTGEIYNLCFEILERFGDDESVFEFVCKTFTGRPKNGTIVIEEYFSEEEIDEYESVNGDTVDGILNSTIKKCNLGLIPVSDFYKVLWGALCAYFSTPKEKAFAFYYVLIDSTIPFQYLGKPVSMSNERFREMVKKNKESIEKVKYIIKSGYSQRTERASLLLNCLNEIDDFESKAVVLAQAIPLFNKSPSVGQLDLDTLIQQIDKKLEELEE